MAPVVLALKQENWATTQVLLTAQHREILDQVLDVFGIVPDHDLNLMKPRQTLSELTAHMLTRLDESLSTLKPDMVLAQGDTTTVMATALACFYKKIPFGHVEAGLRTGDKLNPYPEEMNRVIAGYLSELHFAPTETSKQNLIAGNIPNSAIHVTGNTVIDALLQTAEKKTELGIPLDDTKKLILMTAHRRENFGAPLREAFGAVRELVDRNPDTELLYPVHPNPEVQEPAQEILNGHSRIHLIKPMDYPQFVHAMQRAYLILTDSGGVQEEAPALGKPVLVLREETERPEAVDEGMVRLVGTSRDRILKETEKLLNDESAYQTMAIGRSPYGDGHAAERIVTVLKGYFQSS